MKKYDVKFKESVLSQMFPLDEVSLHGLSDKTGVSYSTLLDWRRALKNKENLGLGDNEVSKNWSSEDKFNIVLQTSAMDEENLNGFCRSRGIYPEQLGIWKDACISANAEQSVLSRTLRNELREERNKTRKLESDLKRKERALAETAALLVLRKKAGAIWGDGEDE